MRRGEPAGTVEGGERLGPDASLFAPGRRHLLALLVAVALCGLSLLALSIAEVAVAPFNIYAVALGIVIVVSGRFAIKVPGRSATVSVSEAFVFASVILFGPEQATIIVAIDGLWISFRQQEPRLYRTLFNITEPAISIWLAGHTFFAIAGPRLAPGTPPDTPVLVAATIAMAAVFFALNSTLTAAAISWEIGASAREAWSRHALYLGINYYAAASLATLGCTSSSGVDAQVVGLLVPLLILSYVAYQEASTRVDAAQRHVGEIKHLYQATVEMLAVAVEGKDQGTHGHVRRVQRNARAVAAALGVTDETDLKAIEAGSLLHDIGKLAVPDHILNKPGALSRAEFDTMKRHATMGARILTAVDFPYPVVPIVRHHHERWDGQGYPDGLIRNEIPLGARILAVIDCFDALTSDRPYRPRLTDAQAIEILRGRSGTFYDPAVVEKFVALIPQLRGEEERAPEEAGLGCVVSSLARTVPSNAVRVEDDAGPAPAVTVRPVLSALIDNQVACLQSAEACLFILDESGDRLVLGHATARMRSGVSGVQLPVGHGLSGWVAANRSTIRNADPVLDFDGRPVPAGVQWCTSTPVFADGELVGVLTVYLARPGRFSEREARFVGTLGQRVGLSLSRHQDEQVEKSGPRALPSARIA